MKETCEIKVCAFEGKKDSDNFFIKYHISFGEATTSESIVVKGVLRNIDDITQKEYDSWKTANVEEYHKKRDYDKIKGILGDLGKILWILSEQQGVIYSFLDSSYHQKAMGGRKLKTFEMNLLKDAYKNGKYDY